MHTGYDNYWMYHNRRQEPLLCSQKNDNLRNQAYTDKYKQVQHKGNSNNYCNSVPNYPNTHQNVPNDQHSMTSTQSMLPSSVFMQPFPPSLTLHYNQNEACQVQPNGVHDSSHSLQNQVLRNVQNYNMNFNPGQTTNYKAGVGPAAPNHIAQINGIRVKDFSSLNNTNGNNNCNSLMVNNSQQALQLKPWYYLNDQWQKVFIDYANSASSQVNSSYQNYGSPASHSFQLSNNQQYPQNPNGYHLPNAGLNGQIGFNNVQQRPEDASQDFNGRNCPAPPRNIVVVQNVIQEADEPGTLPSPGRQSGARAYNNGYGVPDFPERGETNADPQTQLVEPEIQQNIPRYRMTGKHPSRVTTVPSTAQNGGDSALSESSSLPSVREASRGSLPHAEVGVEEDVVNINSSESAAIADREVKESEKMDENQQNAGDEMTETCEQSETVCKSEDDSDCQLVVKSENEGSSEIENAVDEEEIIESSIKPETDIFPYEDEMEHLEETKMLETENAEPFFPENTKIQTVSGASNQNEESDVVVLEEAEEDVEAPKSETVDLTDDDQSSINREKLNLLKEFLKKEEGDPVEVVTIKEDNSELPTNNKQDEQNRKQSRRKLSKTSVVKNKNTEREMITLVSLKTSKSLSRSSSPKFDCKEPKKPKSEPVEISICLENTPETVSKGKQPEETAEEKTPAPIKAEEERKSPKETTDDYLCSGKGITREERNIINIMRAFQSLKNHFCASCDFVSPVETIWINVVSGELRCLNCFKKMIMKSEYNACNPKKGSADERVKTSEVHKDETWDKKESEKEKDFEKKWGDLKRPVKKENGDSSGEPIEGFPQKVKIPKEEEDVKQNKTICGERHAWKYHSREGSSSPKNPTREESKKQESSVKSKAPHGIEKHSEEKPHKKEPSKTKENSSEHEHKIKRHHSSEKHSGKRKSTSSDSEVDVKKPRTTEESSKEKSEKKRRESKENIHKNKAPRTEKEERDPGRKNNESIERSQSPETQDRQCRKAIKLLNPSDEVKRRKKREKDDLLDPTYKPPYRIPIRKEEEPDSPKTHSPKMSKKDGKHEHSRGKHEEKHEHTSGETPNDSRKIFVEQLKHSKQCLISKLFKGRPNTQISPNSKLPDKEPRTMADHKKDHPREPEPKSKDPENRCHCLPKIPRKTPEKDPQKR